MKIKRAPDPLWCFALTHTLAIQRFLARKASGDRSPWEVLTGDTPDISDGEAKYQPGGAEDAPGVA
jgi:hypothetical protein